MHIYTVTASVLFRVLLVNLLKPDKHYLGHPNSNCCMESFEKLVMDQRYHRYECTRINIEKSTFHSTIAMFNETIYKMQHTLHNQTKKYFFFKTRLKILLILERNYFLNTMQPSHFPNIKQFSRNNMLKSPKLQIFAVTLFLTLAKKIIVYRKDFNILTCSGVEMCP